jgi:hypothetical protein
MAPVNDIINTKTKAIIIKRVIWVNFCVFMAISVLLLCNKTGLAFLPGLQDNPVICLDFGGLAIMTDVNRL